ncbi:uncharacterized protein J7T54_005225 [Emericellopsis cladophorae]|uniref:Uncharacterized protein n=1 Tax=Emericellopsis cladophorae TaxID=2686198 RepID=A0A9P9XX14_9HYPO|nr:uncharacterized protein J7T54_005225 [Emericellopsis cladophorae]KAI6779411.1 hypothetical protein J7T54_005225 [Emericellopsis cladophorae]
MAFEEVPQFFLYGHGIPPANLTLGTLVFGNYAQPEGRSAVFQGALDSIVVSSQEFSGCWATRSRSKYGLGLDTLPDLASISAHPQNFLNNYVLRSPRTGATLAQWLTATKSTYLFRKAIFQKLRVYYVTGVYELDGAYGWVERGSDATAALGINGAAMGLATGMPSGFELGPFESSTHLAFKSQVKGRQVWAARFQQLRVDYVRQSNEDDPCIPSNIFLLADETVGRNAVMGSDSPVEEKLVVEGDRSITANAADLGLRDSVEELTDGEEDAYWPVWEEAVAVLDGVAEDRLEAEEDEPLPEPISYSP